MMRTRQFQPTIEQEPIRRKGATAPIQGGGMLQDPEAVGTSDAEPTLSAATILKIQRTQGNRAAQRMVAAHQQQSGHGCNCRSCASKQAVQRMAESAAAVQRCAACSPDDNPVQREDDDDDDTGGYSEAPAQNDAGSSNNQQLSSVSGSLSDVTSGGSGSGYTSGNPGNQWASGGGSSKKDDDGGGDDDPGFWGSWWPFGSGKKDDGNGDNPDNPNDPDNPDPNAAPDPDAMPDDAQAEPYSDTAPGLTPIGITGAMGCDLATPPAPTGKMRMMPLNATVNGSASVSQDESVVDAKKALGMDKTLNGSSLSVDTSESPGWKIDRPWGGTAPFVGTDELQWTARDGAIFLTTPVKVDIKWGIMSAANALDITSANDSKLTQGNYLTVINSMKVGGDGRRINDGDTTAWSSPITTKHEKYHVDHLKRLIAKHLPTFQSAIDGKNIPVSWAPWWTDNDIATAKGHINIIVSRARDKFRDAIQADFMATGETEAYGYCRGDYESLTNGISAYAKGKGW